MLQKDLRIFWNCWKIMIEFKMHQWGNQMKASTTALTAASAERPFTKVFAFRWYTTPTLIRLRYSPTQERFSLKLFPYHFKIHGAVKITAGV